MKKLKKAAAIVCAATFLACLTPSAVFAEDDNETSVEIIEGVMESDEGVEPYTNEHPTEKRSIANNKYEFSGQCNGTASLYTNYMFYGVSNLTMHVNNKSNSSLTVKLEHCGVLHTTVHTFTVPANSTKIETVSVNEKDNYCLKFSCPSNFDGYVF